MPYTSGDTPMVGDSIRDKGGRIGSVTAASHGGIFTVSWHEGVVGADYKDYANEMRSSLASD